MNIKSYSQGIVIAVESAILNFWDFKMKNNFLKMDLTSFHFKLFSFVI